VKLGPGDVLRAENEPIEVTSALPSPDENWRYTDKAGHLHKMVRFDYPTLKWVTDETWWCEDCEDEHDEGHWACRQCDEEIQPGTKPPSIYREYTPGSTYYYLNDQEISEARYRELLEQLEQAQS